VLPLVEFRWVVVGCQAATLLFTWPLWQVHRAPPMLPAAAPPAADLGWLLLSLVVVLVRPLPAVVQPALSVLLVSPLGFYVNRGDAYLAHNLYSANTPQMVICSRGGGCRLEAASGATFAAFNVPLPPEHRLLRAWFGRTCAAGDWILVVDRRRWVRQRRMASRVSAVGRFGRMDETYMCPTMRSCLVCLVVPMLDSDDAVYRSS
jgi:hypothetical protein